MLSLENCILPNGETTRIAPETCSEMGLEKAPPFHELQQQLFGEAVLGVLELIAIVAVIVLLGYGLYQSAYGKYIVRK